MKSKRKNEKMGLIWVLISLFFPGTLGALLLFDALQLKHCTSQLLNHGVVVPGKVEKVSKNRRGQLTWRVSFTTKDGQTVLGKRVSPFQDNTGKPSSDLTEANKHSFIAYAPNHLSCWDISESQDEVKLENNKRRLQFIMTFSFACAFLVTAFAGILWGIFTISSKKENK